MIKVIVFAVARSSELEPVTVAQEIGIGVHSVIESWQVLLGIITKPVP
jgi:hypothetical protein